METREHDVMGYEEKTMLTSLDEQYTCRQSPEIEQLYLGLAVLRDLNMQNARPIYLKCAKCSKNSYEMHKFALPIVFTSRDV